MNNLSISIICFFLTTNGLAQSVWKADIQPVEKNGYYHIELDPQTIAISGKNELTDLKIFDGRSLEVPYFIRPVNPIRDVVSRFESYRLKENDTKDSLNCIVVDNEKNENINRFYILISGAEVTKYASIRGSNDLKQWYIVKQKTSISNFGYNGEYNHEMLIIDFPCGDYRYYEIILSNNQNSPLKVLKVGKFENSSVYGQFTEIDPGKFIRKDSADKRTYLYFPDLSYPYRINKLEFVVRSNADYFRHAEIRNSKGQKQFDFDLSSKSDNIFFIADLILQPDSRIVVENYGNPPLIIDSVKVYGLNRYLCAYLERGQTYSLLTGQKDSIPPRYDIEHFQHDIPADLPIIKTSGLHCLICPENKSFERTPLWIENPVFLRSVIIVIGLFLVFICLKMIREMKDKKQNQESENKE
ncbi:MAG: hypothetical protein FWF54_02060 [Candidatus Azobacteroides sp.]|nr:hypothetical protein [Candidatus Azobacteroides sp.]